jgi:hypothetical protein
MTFTHQTANEIMTTRHVRVPDDLNDVISSRECYLQILSMTIVAEKETKENNGKENDSITHLNNECSRMETRLIELCGESFEDIKNGSEEAMNELFDNADYPINKEEDIVMIDDQGSPHSPQKESAGAEITYASAVGKKSQSIRMRMNFRGQQKKIGDEE